MLGDLIFVSESTCCMGTVNEILKHYGFVVISLSWDFGSLISAGYGKYFALVMPPIFWTIPGNITIPNPN